MMVYISSINIYLNKQFIEQVYKDNDMFYCIFNGNKIILNENEFNEIIC